LGPALPRIKLRTSPESPAAAHKKSPKVETLGPEFKLKRKS